MKHNRNSFQLSRLFGWLIAALLSAHHVEAQVIEIKPQPFFKQCPSLKAGAGEDAVAAALAALKGKEPPSRAKAAQQLGQACDSRAVDPLIDALKDEDAAVRLAAVVALGKLGDKDAVEPLIDLVTDKDHRVRLALISALGSFKFFRARNMVLNGVAITSGPDPDDEADLRVRCAAILTCNQFADTIYSRKAVLFLYNFLQSKNPRTRALAEQTLAELKNTRNGPTEIVAILKQSHDPTLRRWAAEWIGKLALEQGRTALEEAAANDADPSVKRLAAESLTKLKTVK